MISGRRRRGAILWAKPLTACNALLQHWGNRWMSRLIGCEAKYWTKIHTSVGGTSSVVSFLSYKSQITLNTCPVLKRKTGELWRHFQTLKLGGWTLKTDLRAWTMNFAVVIELLCFLVDVNLDRGQGDDDTYNYTYAYMTRMPMTLSIDAIADIRN